MASARVRFRGVERLRVVLIRRSTGDVVLRKRGRSVLTADAWLRAGGYRVVVRGPAGARFRLSVERVVP